MVVPFRVSFQAVRVGDGRFIERNYFVVGKLLNGVTGFGNGGWGRLGVGARGSVGRWGGGKPW